MDKEILMFGGIEIEKNKFYHHKSQISLKDVDTEKILVFNKSSSSEKKTTLLVACIMIIKLSHYI